MADKYHRGPGIEQLRQLEGQIADEERRTRAVMLARLSRDLKQKVSAMRERGWERRERVEEGVGEKGNVVEGVE